MKTRRGAAFLTTFVVSLTGAGAASAQRASMASHAGHESVATHHDDGVAYRSPGLAVVLSLTPMPVDFGNLYAGNIAWGVAYTAIELGLMAPMIWIAADHGMGHGYSGTSNSWTATDRNWMIGLASGYVVVKLVSGLHAGRAAEAFNRDQHEHRISAVIVPSGGGAMALASLRF